MMTSRYSQPIEQASMKKWSKPTNSVNETGLKSCRLIFFLPILSRQMSLDGFRAGFINCWSGASRVVHDWLRMTAYNIFNKRKAKVTIPCIKNNLGGLHTLYPFDLVTTSCSNRASLDIAYARCIALYVRDRKSVAFLMTCDKMCIWCWLNVPYKELVWFVYFCFD